MYKHIICIYIYIYIYTYTHNRDGAACGAPAQSWVRQDGRGDGLHFDSERPLFVSGTPLTSPKAPLFRAPFRVTRFR